MRELRAGKGDSFIYEEDVTPALDRYLEEIGKIPLLTSDEEVDLAKKIKQGDQKALEKLVKANLRFVVNVAKQFRGRGLSFQDLINEGNGGLIKAAERFDETKGFKFISYAVSTIRTKINEAVMEFGRLTRKPTNVNKGFTKLNETKLQKEQELGQELSVYELAHLLKENPDKSYIKNLDQTLDISTKHTSIDAPIVFDDKDSPAMVDNLADTSSKNPDYELEHNESLKKEINTILKTFPEKQKQIIELFFFDPELGSLKNKEEKFKAIATRIGSEVKWTKRGYRMAIEKLKNYSRLREYF